MTKTEVQMVEREVLDTINLYARKMASIYDHDDLMVCKKDVRDIFAKHGVSLDD